jgi:hypothetical protein
LITVMLAYPARAQSITLSGTATQGTGMSGATVTAFAVNTSDGSNGATLGSGPTDSAGNFAITLESAPNAPVRLLATGGTFTSVMDGTTITSRNLISALLGVVTGSLSGISLNPLTKFVNNVTVGTLTHPASGKAPVDFATALANATTTIETDYGLKSDPAMLMPDYTAGGIGTDAGNLGLILGGLINLDEHLVPANCKPGGLVSVLAGDIADGVYDGASFGTPLNYCGVPLPAIAGISEFQDALSGLQQLQLIQQAFVFGGTGNILTSSGITASQLVPSLANINLAVAAAAPPSINSFAAAGDTATLRHPRSSLFSTGTMLTSGRFLIAGGATSTNTEITSETYDQNLNLSLGGPNLNEARSDAAAARLQDGRVFVAGGLNLGGQGLSYLNSTEIFDSAKKTFALGPALKTARYSATATLLPTGKVLIAGGLGNQFPSELASTEIYDPSTNSISTGPSMTAARSGATATLLLNGKILIAGGAANNTAELYDPIANTFASMPPTMSELVTNSTATLLPDGRVLIAGGFNTTFITDTEIYDPATNSFSPGPPLSVPRDLACAALLPTDRVLIAGGDTSTTMVTNSSDLYDPAKNLISSGAAMNIARDTCFAQLLRNAKVFIAGGATQEGNNAIASTELYTP